MAEYIERKAASIALSKEAVHCVKNFKDGEARGYSGATKIIARLPTADVVEVVHGRWAFHAPDEHGNRKPYCTNCGEYPLTSWADYTRCKICPDCGARMDGDRDD